MSEAQISRSTAIDEARYALLELPYREAAILATLVGMALVAASGARGSRALLGFGMFALGIGALDGLHRSRFGFRQVSLVLGIFAAGLGLWSALATGLLVLLELRVPDVMRSLLVASAACAAGCAATALLGVRSQTWHRGSVAVGWLGRPWKRLLARARRWGSRRRDRPVDAGQRLRPAGPVQGG